MGLLKVLVEVPNRIETNSIYQSDQGVKIRELARKPQEL
jgi:hypothetical protein